MGSEGTHKSEGAGQMARENVGGNGGAVSGGDVGKKVVARESHQQHIRGRHAPLLGTAPVPLSFARADNPVAREGHLRHVRGRHAPLDGTTEALARLTKKAPASQKTTTEVAKEEEKEGVEGEVKEEGEKEEKEEEKEVKEDETGVWAAVARAMI